MPQHNINGQWILYEDSGGDGLPIVFSHGLLLDREMFAPQVEELRSGHRVITWDQRCHGLTESTSEAFTFWDSAEDLVGLIDHLGIERAVMGGMSQGGFVSLRFALKHPERVAALVLIDTQAGPEDPEKLATYQVMLDVWEGEGLNDQLAEMVSAIILGNEWSGRGTWIEKWRQTPRSLLRQMFQPIAGRDDVTSRLGEIKAPSLVIHGTEDAAIDMELAQRLCSDLANCRQLVTIEGGGHSSNLTHPAPVNAALKQFLGELSLASASP